MYIKLMIDGTTSKPFSANANPLIMQHFPHKTEIIKHSREKFGRLKNDVEHEISDRYKEMKKNLNGEQGSLFE